MTLLKHHDEPFIDALRDDLPSENDERRALARLLAAGVMTGAGVAVPGTVAAAGVVSAPVGFVAKLSGLSWAAKVGLAGAAAVVAAGAPVAMELASHRPGNVPESTAPESTAATIESTTQRAQQRPATDQIGSALGVSVSSREVETHSRRDRAPAQLHAPGFGATPMATTPNQQKPRSSADAAVARRALAQPTAEASASAPVLAFPTVEVPALPEPGRDARGSALVEAFDEVESTEPQSMLAEESLLIQQAMLALRAGDRAAALYWLGEHTRRFPQGRLERERERALERAHRLAPSEQE